MLIVLTGGDVVAGVAAHDLGPTEIPRADLAQ